MKRSEMEKLLLEGLCDLGQWYHKAPEQVAKALCVLLKPEEGWEAEEPKGLPKRLTVIEVGPASLEHPPFPFLVPAGYAIESKEEQMAIYAAAVEAYNRIQEGGPEAVVIGKALYDELCRAAVKGYLWEAMERRGDGDK